MEEPGIGTVAAGAEAGSGLVAAAEMMAEAAEVGSEEDTRCTGVAAEALGSFAVVQSQGSLSAGPGEKDRRTR